MQAQSKIEFDNVVPLSMVVIMTLFLLMNAKKSQSKYYSSFWVESVPILWLLLVMLF